MSLRDRDSISAYVCCFASHCKAQAILIPVSKYINSLSVQPICLYLQFISEKLFTWWSDPSFTDQYCHITFLSAKHKLIYHLRCVSYLFLCFPFYMFPYSYSFLISLITRASLWSINIPLDTLKMHYKPKLLHMAYLRLNFLCPVDITEIHIVLISAFAFQMQKNGRGLSMFVRHYAKARGLRAPQSFVKT